jgi:hypothetical protein
MACSAMVLSRLLSRTSDYILKLKLGKCEPPKRNPDMRRILNACQYEIVVRLNTCGMVMFQSHWKIATKTKNTTIPSKTRRMRKIGSMIFSRVLSIFSAERLVLPPGYGRVVGVEFGERLPVGSDVLFCFFIC